MKRTISAMVGKGSANHNSRKFKAENVDGSRTWRNIDYCNEPVRDVYHRLFDEALERYNAKQTRADRKIGDYYEKIRSGRQEKPFHELILQIGNRDDMPSNSGHGEEARKILDEYYRGFQSRNPNLYVFSAHIHMDEATPHIHIDFVPFVTGSSRGLETRVSLKGALSVQGFKGGSRGATEWAQWVQSEKEQLALVMERHGYEWEQKGTHEQHLSVIEYKKEERKKELEAVEEKLADKKDELSTVSERIRNVQESGYALTRLEEDLEKDPEYKLPDPPPLITAKGYKTRFVDPLIERLKELVKNLLERYFKVRDDYISIKRENRALNEENNNLTESCDKLFEENLILKGQNQDYNLLRKTFGRNYLDDLIRKAKQIHRARSEDWER